MSFWESLLKAFTDNSRNTNSIEQNRMFNIMKQILFASDITSKKKEKNNNPNQDIDKKNEYDEFGAIATTSQIAGLMLTDDLNDEEKRLTEECISIRDRIENSELSPEDKNKLLEELRSKYKQLCECREQYDEAIEFTSDVTDKTSSIFSRFKSPYFTKSKKERDEEDDFNWEIEGNEDPFYDYLNELYPGKGLQGFREENIDKFKDISKRTVSLASQRYQKVAKILRKTKRIAAIPLALASYAFYPYLAPYCNPFIYGVAMYAYSAALLRLPEFIRDTHNRRIFAARYRIAKDLGVLNKDFGSGVLRWDQYYEHDYGKEPPKKDKEKDKDLYE